jgi:ribosome-associated protein
MNTPELQKLLNNALEDIKATDVLALDVTQLTSMTDSMIICCGRSDRHVKSIADKAADAGLKAGHKPLHCQGGDVGEWVVVDFGNVMLHVMQPEIRSFYDLESLWTVQ